MPAKRWPRGPLLALGVAEFLVDVAEHLVGGARAEGVEDVFLGVRDGERLADRLAALGDDGVHGDVALERDGHAAGHDAVVAEDPRFGLAGDAVGHAAEDGHARVRGVPLLEPELDVERKRIEENEPGLDVGGLEPGAAMPVLGAVGGLDGVLREMDGRGLGAGQRHHHEREAGAVLLLPAGADEAGAAAADERGHVAVDADELEQVGRLVGVIGRDEDQAEGGLA